MRPKKYENYCINIEVKMDERFYRNETQRSTDRPFSRPAQPQFGGQVGGQNGGVVIYSPRTYQDVQLLIDHLKMREQVIVDFSTLNQQSTYTILDFRSGAVYALGGSIQQITKNIFLFAPQGVTITIPPQLRA